jgi:metal-responsive CopG/Arc/MetJ family transcriptional regulator
MGKQFISKRSGEMMENITVTLTETLVRRLDQEAEKRGTTRSGAVEKVLGKCIPKLPGRPKK